MYIEKSDLSFKVLPKTLKMAEKIWNCIITLAKDIITVDPPLRSVHYSHLLRNCAILLFVFSLNFSSEVSGVFVLFSMQDFIRRAKLRKKGFKVFWPKVRFHSPTLSINFLNSIISLVIRITTSTGGKSIFLSVEFPSITEFLLPQNYWIVLSEWN